MTSPLANLISLGFISRVLYDHDYDEGALVAPGEEQSRPSHTYAAGVRVYGILRMYKSDISRRVIHLCTAPRRAGTDDQDLRVAVNRARCL